MIWIQGLRVKIRGAETGGTWRPRRTTRMPQGPREINFLVFCGPDPSVNLASRMPQAGDNAAVYIP